MPMKCVFLTAALGCLAAACGQPEQSSPAAAPNSVPNTAPAVSSRPTPTTPADALQSQNTNWGMVVADVLEFKRRGNVLTAVGRLRNEGLVELNLSAAYLLDEAQGRKYKALVDENGDVIGCCHGTTALSSTGTQAFWVKFPAPPPDVKTITLVFPQTTPFENLTIQEQ
jgi:hypothetical protein